MSDLSKDNQASLRQYHVALRQFLSVSPAPAKLNPTRAAKAREKLLKLSASQFFELSTDVYDELQRRISESQEEPDFLLPMENFHPKRNEAREKLGSLQQTRFRDLVSDIFYEIERRNQQYAKAEAESSSFSHSTDNRVSTNTILTNASQEDPRSVQQNTRSSVQSKTSTEGRKKNVVTLQPTTVIPTEADMAWSSDEEETLSAKKTRSSVNDTSNSLVQSPGSVSKAVTAVVASQSPYAPSNRTSRTSANSPTAFRSLPSVLSNESPRLVPAKRQSNASQISDSRDAVGEMNGFSSNEPRIQRGLSVTKNRNKDREIELLIQEGTKMDSKITDLEQKNTLLHTKSEKFEQEVKTLQALKDSLTSKINRLESVVVEKNAAIQSLEKRLESAKSETLTTNAPVSSTRSLNKEVNGSSVMDVEDSVWKKKYQQIKEFHTRSTPSIGSISDESLEKHISPSGAIPLSLVVKLRTDVESYLSTLSLSDHASDSTGELFERMSYISDTAAKIACRVPSSEKAEMVRAAIAHAITSTRYYSIYAELLPKLVVESAVCQVAFSVFELVSDAKLMKDDKSSTATTPISTQRPSAKYEDSADADVSPVRPLRMAKKADGTTSPATPRSVSTTLTPKPLNLTINSQLANGTKNTDRKPSAQSTRDTHRNASINDGETRSTSTNNETKTPSRRSPLASRYSPEASKAQLGTSPVTGLRKSSSGNILSKVKQFEQQTETTPTSSPSSKKPTIVSPLSDNAFGLFGKRKVSETNGRSIVDAIPLSNGSTVTKPALVPSTDDAKPLYTADANQVLSSGAHGVNNEDSASDGQTPQSFIELGGSPMNNDLKTPLSTDDESSGLINDLKLSKNTVVDEKSSLPENKIVSQMNGMSSPTKGIFNTKVITGEDISSSTSAKMITEQFGPASTTMPVTETISPLKSEKTGQLVTDDADQDDVKSSGTTERHVDEESFDVEDFDIENPDNTLSELLLYLEHQTVKVISTIQALLTSIKTADSTKGQLRSGSKDISDVVSQMVEATSNSMNQSRNAQLKEHGTWVVDSLADSKMRMNSLCTKTSGVEDDEEYADKQFKQRLAGIAFDVAKCTKELVKTVEEANLQEEIAHLNARLVR